MRHQRWNDRRIDVQTIDKYLVDGLVKVNRVDPIAMRGVGLWVDINKKCSLLGSG